MLTPSDHHDVAILSLVVNVGHELRIQKGELGNKILEEGTRRVTLDLTSNMSCDSVM